MTSDEVIKNCLKSINRQYQVILVENSNDFELKKMLNENLVM